MLPRSYWASLLVVAGLIVGLLTIEPVAGLFAQTFRTAGVIASEPETPTPVAEARANQTTASATKIAASATTSATPTPSASATLTATWTSKAAPGPIATPSRATTYPGAASSPIVITSAATSTATSTAIVCPARPPVVTLEPKEDRLQLDVSATSTLTLSNANGVPLPDAALLRLTFVGTTPNSIRVTALGSTWTPTAAQITHEWRFGGQATGASRQIAIAFEQTPSLSVTVARTSNVETRAHFDVVRPACGAAAEAIVASADIVLIPVPPTPMPSPTATSTTVVASMPVPSATSLPILTAVVATPLLSKPFSAAPAAPVAVQKGAIDVTAAR